MILVVLRAEANTATRLDHIVELEHLFKVLLQPPPTALADAYVRWRVLTPLLVAAADVRDADGRLTAGL